MEYLKFNCSNKKKLLIQIQCVKLAVVADNLPYETHFVRSKAEMKSIYLVFCFFVTVLCSDESDKSDKSERKAPCISIPQ